MRKRTNQTRLTQTGNFWCAGVVRDKCVTKGRLT